MLKRTSDFVGAALLLRRREGAEGKIAHVCKEIMAVF